MTRLEDLADLTLIDENTKLILTDDANKEISPIPENLRLRWTENISQSVPRPHLIIHIYYFDSWPFHFVL